MSEDVLPAYVKLSVIHKLFMPTASRKTVLRHLDKAGVTLRVGSGHPVVDVGELQTKFPKVYRRLLVSTHL